MLTSACCAMTSRTLIDNPEAKFPAIKEQLASKEGNVLLYLNVNICSKRIFNAFLYLLYILAGCS